ncbi:SMC-Scp complex subunit ScpB [Acetobacter sp.]|uniref:SMC-Scp complex subunit ScpB n=1 Tax=Acetobacter sp. TaxID=440 RepID=UPI0039EAF402
MSGEAAVVEQALPGHALPDHALSGSPEPSRPEPDDTVPAGSASGNPAPESSLQAPPFVPDDAVRLAEALIFASVDPVSTRRLADLLEARQIMPAGQDDLAAFVDAVLQSLQQRYAGRGVAPVEVAGGWQFRTAPDLAPLLTRVLERPRRLPRAVMETLAIIAYHQPCTRTEVEDIRGVSLGQTVLDTLIETGLIAPRGRKEVPGRPVLWGTTPDFLRHFGLRALSDLPRREELLVDLPETQSGYGTAQSEIAFAAARESGHDGPHLPEQGPALQQEPEQAGPEDAQGPTQAKEQDGADGPYGSEAPDGPDQGNGGADGQEDTVYADPHP